MLGELGRSSKLFLVFSEVSMLPACSMTCGPCRVAELAFPDCLLSRGGERWERKGSRGRGGAWLVELLPSTRKALGDLCGLTEGGGGVAIQGYIMSLRSVGLHKPLSQSGGGVRLGLGDRKGEMANKQHGGTWQRPHRRGSTQL